MQIYFENLEFWDIFGYDDFWVFFLCLKVILGWFGWYIFFVVIQLKWDLMNFSLILVSYLVYFVGLI